MPVGYKWLRDNLRLEALPPHTAVFVVGEGPKLDSPDQEIIQVRKDIVLPTTPAGHVLFALKHEGVNLELLHKSFVALGRKAILSELLTQPTGALARRCGFLYEMLTGDELQIQNRPLTAYADILPEDKYVVAPAKKNRRWVVNDNLPGTVEFCPLVRRTPTVDAALAFPFRQSIEAEIGSYPEHLVQRAASYLYLKETKASFEIEKERPDIKRSQRFAALLRQAGKLPTLTEDSLAALQRLIVDMQFANKGYRTIQNYVGETLGAHRELVHYIPPQPEKVQPLMRGLLDYMAATEGRLPPIARAAAASFGFVLIHPFDDGNGRLHRFLIHHLLAKDGVFPEGMMVPVSARMLNNRRGYDACLESFSAPLMAVANYNLDGVGRLSMKSDLTDTYRYFDATPFVEYLARVVGESIQTDLRSELHFLAAYDQIVPEIRAVSDMPDNDMNLLIKLVAQTGGALSKNKRHLFPKLSDLEIAEIAAVIRHYLPALTEAQLPPLAAAGITAQPRAARRISGTMYYF